MRESAIRDLVRAISINLAPDMDRTLTVVHRSAQSGFASIPCLG